MIKEGSSFDQDLSSFDGKRKKSCNQKWMSCYVMFFFYSSPVCVAFNFCVPKITKTFLKLLQRRERKKRFFEAMKISNISIIF